MPILRKSIFAGSGSTLPTFLVTGVTWAVAGHDFRLSIGSPCRSLGRPGYSWGASGTSFRPSKGVFRHSRDALEEHLGAPRCQEACQKQSWVDSGSSHPCLKRRCLQKHAYGPFAVRTLTAQRYVRSTLNPLRTVSAHGRVEQNP